MRKIVLAVSLVFILTHSFCREARGSGIFTYEMINFTRDGSPTGTPLAPDFVMSACWWALGNDDNGNIYAGISHEIYPGGNVAIFKYDPVLNRMTFLNDTKSVSTAAGNWLPTESQQKVHTRLLNGGDGRLYFASDDNTTGKLSEHRGTHIYAISNDTIIDLSATATQYLNTAMQTVNSNIGVHIQNYGTIALEMPPGKPRLLYGITYGDAYLYRLNLDTGAIKMIARTGTGYEAGIIRNFAVDAKGNAYVPMRGAAPGDIRIFKYDNDAGTWNYTGKSYWDNHLAQTEFDKSGWRMHVYSKARDKIYFVSFDGKIYRFTFSAELLEYVGILQLNPDPVTTNLILSDDEQHLYALTFMYAGLNQNYFVDFNTQTGRTKTIDSTIMPYGKRDLIYGGLAKDKLGHAYVVGWKFGNTSPANIALFKINVEPGKK